MEEERRLKEQARLIEEQMELERLLELERLENAQRETERGEEQRLLQTKRFDVEEQVSLR